MAAGSTRSPKADRNSVKVAVRLRPFNKNETRRGDDRVVDVVEDQVVLHPNPSAEARASGTPARNSKKTFRYDNCYWSLAADDNQKLGTQSRIFDELGKPLIDHAFDGFNNCIFAYGQTGSGKSYTMMGTSNDEGLIPRIGQEIFQRVDELKSDTAKFSVEVSYLEIYNEKVRDLLNPKSKGNLKVREHPSFGPYVEDLSKLMVSSFDEIRSLIAEGNKTRTVAATDMNQTSSRSHAVFTITLSQVFYDKQTDMASEKQSRVSLVDLAGSERSTVSGTSGVRLKEGSEINRSLATLGRVIATLSETTSSKKVVPYRDSTLTWLLKDSLGGNSMTTMVATISPSPASWEQTLSTLRFADSAKKIQNKAVVNEDPNAKLIRELKQELSDLKQGIDQEHVGQSKDLREQLQLTEKLLADANLTWEQRLLNTQEIQRQREKSLEDLGISLDNGLIGINTPKKVPHLVNLSEDPLLAECLVYNIQAGGTQVTNIDSEVHGIRLQGERILSPHCAFKSEDDKVTITPAENASVIVNGSKVKEPMRLHSGYRIILGGTHVFRFNHPQEALEHRRRSGFYTSSPLSKEVVAEPADWEYAVHEVADHFAQNSLSSIADEDFDRLYEEMERVKAYRTTARDSFQIQSLRPKTPPSLGGSPLALSPTRHRRHTSSVGRRLSISMQSDCSDFGEEYVRDREGLLKRILVRWRSHKLMELVDGVIGIQDLINKAQQFSDEMHSEMNFQPMIVGDEGYQRFSDIVGKPDSYDTSIMTEDSVTGTGGEQVCVRVIDFSNECIKVWPVSKLEGRAKLAERMLDLKFGAVSQHTSFNDPFADGVADLTLIGYSRVAVSLVRRQGKTMSDIISPYTHAVCGIATFEYGENLVVKVGGFSGDEVHDVWVVVDDDHHPVRLVNGIATFDLALNTKTMGIVLYGKVTSQYLLKLVSWDEMQEPGLDKTILNNSRGLDIFTRLQCTELSEKGSYDATDVLMQDGCILLHQGLQRRLVLSIHCPVDLLKDASLRLGDIRLVDLQGKTYHDEDCQWVELSRVSGPISTVDGNGFKVFKLEFQWDSSAHHCRHLDRNTKEGYRVLMGSELALKLKTEEQLLLQFDFKVCVKPRQVSSISLWGRFVAGSKYGEYTTHTFAVSRRPIVPVTYEDFAAISPSKHDAYRVRGVSLLREYFKSQERDELHLQLQESRARVAGLQIAAKKAVTAADYEVLHDCISKWKRPTASRDTRLKQWDYRELLIQTGTYTLPKQPASSQCQVLSSKHVLKAQQGTDFEAGVDYAELTGPFDVSVEALTWRTFTMTMQHNYIYFYDTNNNSLEAVSMNIYNWDLESKDVGLTKQNIVKLEFNHEFVATGRPAQVMVNFWTRDDHERFLLLCNRLLNEYHDRRYE